MIHACAVDPAQRVAATRKFHAFNVSRHGPVLASQGGVPPSRLPILAAGALLALVAGCQAPADEAASSGDDAIHDPGDKLITSERPEVGAFYTGGFAMCTGTLIRRDVVLTAGHCVQYIEREWAQDRSTVFEFERYVPTATNQPRLLYKAHVTKTSNSSMSGAIAIYGDDWALAKLDAPVPASAVPQVATIATSGPNLGANIVFFGAGIRQDGEVPDNFVRRYATTWGSSLHSLPGDSGGPTFYGDGLVGVHNGVWFDVAVNTHMWERRDAVARAIADLDRTTP